MTEALKAADAMLALAGLMNDQKMLKELRMARDEAYAAITKLAGLNVQAAEAADCKTQWRPR
jgi:hypothetical protein